MSGAESPVGATTIIGSSPAAPPPSSPSPPSLPPPQQQQEMTAAQFSDTIREILKQQQEMTAAHLSDAVREIIRQQQEQGIIARARSRSEALRGWLMLVATLTASITYSAALNPTGGFWQGGDAPSYRPGTPVLADVSPARYKAFYYFNFTSFVTSLCIIALSSTPALYDTFPSLLSNLVTVDLVTLAGAFVASSWTRFTELIYGSALLAVGVLYVSCVSKFGCRLGA